MPNYDTLAVEQEGGVATVAFDDAARRNALDIDVANELVDVATAVGADPDVRCIVLTHEGDFFGAGADLSQFEGDESDVPTFRRLAGRLHEAIVQFHQAETPVVGAVDGVAAGAGFSLALAPDLLVLSENARLEFAYPRLGLTGDGGSTFFLPRLVGLRSAKQIVLLDKPITPKRALDLGLATEVVPADDFEDRVEELATELAAGPTHAYGNVLRLLTESYDRSLVTQLAAETDTIARAAHTEDYRRGVAAFFDDGDPTFTGE